jgi:hypothetical protein
MKLGGLVGKSASGLGVRFSLVGILPTTVLVLFVLALVWGGAPASPPSLPTVLSELARYDTAQGLLLVVAILALVLLLQPFQLLLIRLMEGYWGFSGPVGALCKRLADRHRKQRDRLQTRLDHLLAAASRDAATGNRTAPPTAEAGFLSERIARLYPRGRTLPTRLGNVLRAAEENAGAPYGLDLVTLWPRLYAILPERTAALVDDQRNQLDMAVRFWVTFGVATVVSTGLLYRHGWWLAVPAVTLVLTWVCYRGAIASALVYGLGIRTAVDLYRFDLLRALHLPLPEDRESEKQTNAILSEFLRQGRPVDFHYDHPLDK